MCCNSLHERFAHFCISVYDQILTNNRNTSVMFTENAKVSLKCKMKCDCLLPEDIEKCRHRLQVLLLMTLLLATSQIIYLYI